MENSGEKRKIQDDLLIAIPVQLLPGETRLQFSKRIKELIEGKIGLAVALSGVPLEE